MVDRYPLAQLPTVLMNEPPRTTRAIPRAGPTGFVAGCGVFVTAFQ
jgi:hypothetical protein